MLEDTYLRGGHGKIPTERIIYPSDFEADGGPGGNLKANHITAIYGLVTRGG